MSQEKLISCKSELKKVKIVLSDKIDELMGLCFSAHNILLYLLEYESVEGFQGV